MKKIVAYLLLLTMSTMLLVGCGGNDTPKKEESSAEETTEKEPEEEPEEAEVEKETVKGIGIQTIEGKCDGVDYTVTYDGDVLHLENEEDLSDTNNVRFTSLEDKLKIRVRTDEKNFAGDNTLNRIYTEEVEEIETLERKYTYEDGTVEIYTYPEYDFTEPVDKTIGSFAGKYFDVAITDSRGESFTRHYFMFEYDEYHYSIVYYDSATEEQVAKFEELTAAATLEITCEGMLPGNENGIVNAGQEKDVNKVQLLYNDGSSKMEISYNQLTAHIDEYFLNEPQPELEVIYDNGNGAYRYLFSIDNANYTSVDDFYQINVNDCKKMFSDAVATELKEIPCGNITFYTFTMTYTDRQNNAVTAPLYFAEIEPGVYIYTNLGDTMQFGDVNEDKLAVDVEMLKETFINVDIL